MEASVHRMVSFGRLLGVLVVLLLTGAFASSAAADTVTIQQSQPTPVVGESVTFTAPASSDCPKTYTFTVDGTPLPSQTTNSITRSFSAPGTHNVSVDIPAIEGCQEITGSDTFTVSADLSGSIAVSPDPPVVNQPATLTATQSGGSGNYTYAWDLNDDGTFGGPGDSTDRQPTTTFTTTGPHLVKVKIDDDSGHEVIVQRTLNVQPPTTSTPPPPPPCVSKLDFQLSEFETSGCFTHVGSSPATYTTTSAVTLNGITFPDFGQTFTVTYPSAQNPGGHFSAPNSVIRIGSVKVFSGNIDWPLPAGNQGDEQALKTFSSLFGCAAVRSEPRRVGQPQPRVGLRDERPALRIVRPEHPATSRFSAGPDPSFGSVTGAASLRVNDAGVHYNGLQVEADNVWIGKLKVDQVFFSYIPAGGQTVNPCAAPSLDGSPFITCATDVTTDRWNGNATIELPGSGVTLAAFGLAGGQVSTSAGSSTTLAARRRSHRTST